MPEYPVVKLADGKYIAVCEAIQGAENALTDDAKVEAGKLLVKAMYPFMPDSTCCCGGY